MSSSFTGVLIKLRRLLSILLQYHTTAGGSNTKILHTEMDGIQIGNECFMKCLAPFAIVTRTFSNDTIGPVIVSLQHLFHSITFLLPITHLPKLDYSMRIRLHAPPPGYNSWQIYQR